MKILKKCETCGKEMALYPSWGQRKFCGRVCRWGLTSVSLPEQELGWMAGLFDGEGYVTIHVTQPKEGVRRTPQLVSRAGIGNTEIELLKPFLVFGGKIRLDTHRSKISRKPMFRYEANATRSSVLLKTLLPYLRSPKKIARARLVLEFQAQKVNGGRVTTEYIKRQMRYRDRIIELKEVEDQSKSEL